MNSIPRIIITPGEPAGIGPDVVLKAACHSFPAQYVVIADKDLLQSRNNELSLAVDLIDFEPGKSIASTKPNQLQVWHHPINTEISSGKPSIANASYVLDTIRLATEACLDNQFDALVTGPIHKHLINEAGFHFTGHTDYLAELCGSQDVLMTFVARDLIVGLVTTHIPLQQVSQAITSQRIEKSFYLLHELLQQQYHINDPHILIAGLNPHAGESGVLGDEEQKIIIPAVQSLQQQGYSLTGPCSPDTMFIPENIELADAMLHMYHDQALPAVKCYSFNRAVNVTLGLPIIRTSVDHGTAFDLAGTGRACEDSLCEAIKLAIQLS